MPQIFSTMFTCLLDTMKPENSQVIHFEVATGPAAPPQVIKMKTKVYKGARGLSLGVVKLSVAKLVNIMREFYFPTFYELI